MQGQMYTGSCACVLHCVIVMAGLQGLEHMCMRTDGPMYKVDRNHNSRLVRIYKPHGYTGLFLQCVGRM
jgi:hypothetical protein